MGCGADAPGQPPSPAGEDSVRTPPPPAGGRAAGRSAQIVVSFMVGGGISSSADSSLRSAITETFSSGPMTSGSIALSSGLYEHVVVTPPAQVAAGSGPGTTQASRLRTFGRQ
jgi:hypothetical protein